MFRKRRLDVLMVAQTGLSNSALPHCTIFFILLNEKHGKITPSTSERKQYPIASIEAVKI